MAIRRNSVQSDAVGVKAIKVLHEVPAACARYSCSCAQVVSYNGRAFCLSIEVGNNYCYNKVQVRTQNGDWADVGTPVGIKGAEYISYIENALDQRRMMAKNIEAMKQYIVDTYPIELS